MKTTMNYDKLLRDIVGDLLGAGVDKDILLEIASKYNLVSYIVEEALADESMTFDDATALLTEDIYTPAQARQIFDAYWCKGRNGELPDKVFTLLKETKPVYNTVEINPDERAHNENADREVPLRYSVQRRNHKL